MNNNNRDRNSQQYQFKQKDQFNTQISVQAREFIPQTGYQFNSEAQSF